MDQNKDEILTKCKWYLHEPLSSLKVQLNSCGYIILKIT